MSAPKTTITIPETITIGGNVYKWKETPELKSFVDTVSASASQAEKNKLYSTYAELRTEIENLKELEQPASNILDTQGLLKEISVLIEDKIKPIKERFNEQDRFSVNEYRNKLLSENRDSCLAELVVGNTKEELDAALAYSKQSFLKYFPDGKIPSATNTVTAQPVITAQPTEQKTETTNETITAPVVVKAPSTIEQPKPDDELKNIRSMDAKKFSEKREDLLEKLKAANPQVA